MLNIRKPLSFHSVFFGSEDSTPSVLAQMSDIARDVYTKHSKGKGADPRTACTYTNAIDTVGLFGLCEDEVHVAHSKYI